MYIYLCAYIYTYARVTCTYIYTADGDWRVSVVRRGGYARRHQPNGKFISNSLIVPFPSSLAHFNLGVSITSSPIGHTSTSGHLRS